ncbi:hypothetical protein RQP46_009049 [Phenoliferia psychrophenolica]
MISTLAGAEVPWTATTSASHSSSASSSSDSDSASLSEPVVEYDSEHGFELPRTGEGYTTRKGKDYRAKSTWYLKTFWQRTWSERVLGLLYRPEMESQYFITNVERGPIPTGNLVEDNAFIFSSGMAPILLQTAAYWAYPEFKWPLWFAGGVYSAFFAVFAATLVYRFNRDVLLYGVFDEKNFGRDRLADTGVFTVLRGISATIVFRTGLSFFMGYNPAENPLGSFSLSYPLRLVAFIVTYDYFFYAYHRSCHQFDSLWAIHQLHHTTKHPTILHAILADGFQEIIEIVLVPSFTCMLIPMSFAELWLTLIYMFAVEVGGHTGVRLHQSHPVLWFLKYVNMELCLEDHDLHHRNGKSGLCYGKQSRVWDQLFGTVGDRIETAGM